MRTIIVNPLWRLGAAALALAIGLGSPGRADDLLDAARQRKEVEAQRLELEVRRAVREADKLAATDPTSAADLLQRTLTTLTDDQSLSATRRESLRRMLQDRVRVAQLAARTGDQKAEEQATKKAAEAGRKAGETRRVGDQEALQSGLANVKRLQDQGRTEEARRLAEDLQRRYPESPAAAAATRTSGTAADVINARRQLLDRDRRGAAVSRDIERSAIPSGDIEFPADWKSKTEKRSSLRVTTKERAILKALNATLPNVDFKGSPFDAVMEYLQTATGQAIILDKLGLEEAQVTSESPVTMKARDVTLRTVLRKVLADLNLAYIIKDEAIQITSLARARETMTVRTYYLGDLVAVTDIRFGPAITQLQVLQNARAIVDQITSSVEPQSWQVNGGKGTIVFDPSSLSIVVKQTAEVHFMLFGSR